MNEKSNIIRQTHDKSVDEVSYKSGQTTHLWNHLFGLASILGKRRGIMWVFKKDKSTKD